MLEKKSPGKVGGSRGNMPRGTVDIYTNTRKMKFKGAYNDMKGDVFDIGRSQAYNYRHEMTMMQVVTGVTFKATELSAVKDLKEKQQC